MSTKTPGEMFWQAAKNHLYNDGELSHDERCDSAAAEYDKARAQLPEDVEAFVAEVEARANKATQGPWHCGHFEKWHVFARYDEGLAGLGGKRVLLRFNEHFTYADDAEFVAHARADIPRLLAIIRAQAFAEGANRAAFTALYEAAKVQSEEIERMKIAAESRAAVAANLEDVAREACAERDAVRDRLARLEKAIAMAHAYLVDEGTAKDCECRGCSITRELSELVKGAEAVTTQTNEERKQ